MRISTAYKFVAFGAAVAAGVVLWIVGLRGSPALPPETRVGTSGPWQVRAYPVDGADEYKTRLDRDAAAISRVRPTDFVKSLHRLRLAAVLPEAPVAKRDLTDCLRHEMFSRLYPTSATPLIRRSPWGGWQISHNRRAETPDKTSVQGESHTDQVLAACGEVGVPRDQEVITHSGEVLSLADLIATARETFVLSQECEWSLAAFGSYYPTNSEWVNRFGEECSYAKIGNHFAAQPLGAGACWGCHKLYAICFLLQLHATYGVLTPSEQNTLAAYIVKARDAIAATQQRNGCWDANWATPGSWRDGDGPLELQKRKLITSHHLEWIAICPPEFRPPAAAIWRAVNFMSNSLHSETEEGIIQAYCPYSHYGRFAALCTSQISSPMGK